MRGQHDSSGPGQRRAWFAHPSCGKQRTSAERICRIQKHDVGVAPQSQVLESIVENKPSRTMLLEGPSVCVAVLAHSELRAPAQTLAKQRDFIRERQSISVNLPITSIAASQNRGVVPLRLPGVPRAKAPWASFRCRQPLDCPR